MDSKLISRILAISFAILTFLILWIVVTLPYGSETKLKMLNQEMVSMLLTPWTGLLGALLKGLVDKKD